MFSGSYSDVKLDFPFHQSLYIFSGTMKVAEVTSRFSNVPKFLLLDEVFVFPISVEP